MAKVMVEVVADSISYSYSNGDGTHTRESYSHGQKFEMEEADAEKAAEGFVPSPPTMMVNSMGTHVMVHPPKPDGMARAAVKILGPVDSPAVGKAHAPTQKERISPDPKKGLLQ